MYIAYPQTIPNFLRSTGFLCVLLQNTTARAHTPLTPVLEIAVSYAPGNKWWEWYVTTTNPARRH